MLTLPRYVVDMVMIDNIPRKCQHHHLLATTTINGAFVTYVLARETHDGSPSMTSCVEIGRKRACVSSLEVTKVLSPGLKTYR